VIRSVFHPVQRQVGIAGAVLLLFALPILASDLEITRSFDARPGGRLVVDAEATSVEVRSGSGDEVTVRVARKGSSRTPIADDYNVDVTQSGDTVSLKIDQKKRWGWGLGNRGLEAVITVPTEFDADIDTSGGSVSVEDLRGDVKVDTSGGSVELGDIDGRVGVDTSGGSIRIRAVSGDAALDTSGGSITVERADASVDAKTSGGSITIREIAGAIRAKTSGGSIQVTLTETPGADSELDTSGGGISVKLAAGVALDLDAQASGGSLTTDLEIAVKEKSRTRLVGSIGGGGPSMVLRSSGGGVRVVAN
jgi:hypothetical protein